MLPISPTGFDEAACQRHFGVRDDLETNDRILAEIERRLKRPSLHAVVINWPGQTANCMAIERALRPHVDVFSVLNKDPSVDRVDWLNLPQDEWGSAQLNHIFACCLSEWALVICADATSGDWHKLAAAIRELPREIGVYAPNVDFTPWTFDRRKLKEVDDLPLMYHVPQTDAICWAIRREIYSKWVPIDCQANKFGAGIDFAISAMAAMRGFAVVRDYALTIRHPRGSSYDTAEAGRGMQRYLASMEPELRATVLCLIEECGRLR